MNQLTVGWTQELRKHLNFIYCTLNANIYISSIAGDDILKIVFVTVV